jgi:dTDP-glucose 4,6-dehydratase
MQTVLITGGAGFIGHLLIDEFIRDHQVICMVRPGSANLDRIRKFQNQIRIIEHDIKDAYDTLLDDLRDVTLILHAGGNPSSEASVLDPVSVVMDNVLGTLQILELARKLNIKRFFYYGAGESFGPIAPGTDSAETDAYNSITPYSASKASGAELCVSYASAYNIPVSIINVSNTFGPRSQRNRLPVIAIRKILSGGCIDIHVDNDGTIGGRRWLHAADVALHTRFILEHQTTLCEKWNSTGPDYINNLRLVEMIAAMLEEELNYKLVPIQRVGHTPYLSMTPSKLYTSGWRAPISNYTRLEDTVRWYRNNPEWL